MANKHPESTASFKLVTFLLSLTRIIPLRMSYSLCSFVVFTGSRINWKRKKIALDNLRIVFPEKDEKEIRSIFRKSLNLLPRAEGYIRQKEACRLGTLSASAVPSDLNCISLLFHFIISLFI